MGQSLDREDLRAFSREPAFLIVQYQGTHKMNKNEKIILVVGRQSTEVLFTLLTKLPGFDSQEKIFSLFTA